MGQVGRMIDLRDVAIDPRRDLIVIIEPSAGFKGGTLTFEFPIEPIDSYVAMIMAFCSERNIYISNSLQSLPFDIIGWDPGTQELRVRLHEGAVGR